MNTDSGVLLGLIGIITHKFEKRISELPSSVAGGGSEEPPWMAAARIGSMDAEKREKDPPPLSDIASLGDITHQAAREGRLSPIYKRINSR